MTALELLKYCGAAGLAIVGLIVGYMIVLTLKFHKRAMGNYSGKLKKPK